MSEETVDDFLSMFAGPPGEAQRSAREARAKRERRTQLTKKQRKRGGVRTTQINFRCSPAFKADVKGMSEFLGCSMADVLEDALSLLAEAKGYDGGH